MASYFIASIATISWLTRREQQAVRGGKDDLHGKEVSVLSHWATFRMAVISSPTAIRKLDPDRIALRLRPFRRLPSVLCSSTPHSFFGASGSSSRLQYFLTSVQLTPERTGRYPLVIVR
ncbi:hypothetical protein PGTUg99_017196 [Puccinia graminis f. sp. tritici]|uniref:Uncharacterized protein n=1 Tax=Puccinia graminis f. sp. tritici TaxID=56615 RepID=A0A5B0Q7T3_PUCGR|nr:hypothetical protein PGTUg99_017196 [Puccinia graminis f. sp. tritici]